MQIDDTIKFLVGVIAFLIYIIYSITTSKKYIKRIAKLINTWTLRFSKPRVNHTISIQDILDKRHVSVTILDEMIGYFEAAHIGVFVFHNGSVSLNGLHLYKISMIDERSRLYSVVMENQNLPASLFLDLILEIKEKKYVEVDKLTTNISWLKDALAPLTNINYMYYTIHFTNDTPEYVISVGTTKKLDKKQLEKLTNYYNPLLNQMYSNRLENNFYEALKRDEI